MSKGIPDYLKDVSPQKKGRLRETKAQKTIASGQIWFDKGDLKVSTLDENYHIDVKDVSVQKCYNLSLKNIDKIYKEAGSKTPVFLIYIGRYLVKAIVQVAPK